LQLMACFSCGRAVCRHAACSLRGMACGPQMVPREGRPIHVVGAQVSIGGGLRLTVKRQSLERRGACALTGILGSTALDDPSRPRYNRIMELLARRPRAHRRWRAHHPLNPDRDLRALASARPPRCERVAGRSIEVIPAGQRVDAGRSRTPASDAVAAAFCCRCVVDA
jgi:hypothetical protein